MKQSAHVRVARVVVNDLCNLVGGSHKSHIIFMHVLRG